MTSSTGRSRGSYAKSAARREEILQAAMEVFSAGFHQGSLREVCEKAGLSQAGLLHHFPSKERLFEAVLERRDEHVRNLIGDPAEDGIGALHGVLRLIDYNTRTRGLVELHCVVTAEGTQPGHPGHTYFVSRYREVIDTVTAAFEKLAADGILRPGVDPARAARGLIALADGLQVQWLLDRDSVDMVADVRTHLESLLTIKL